jgi:pimeloyl-ACP methyl ester carboxylesterase
MALVRSQRYYECETYERFSQNLGQDADMTTDTSTRPVEDCLLDLFQHLGIGQAHIAAGGPPPLTDWLGLATRHPELIASLNLISPPLVDTAPLAGLATRLLVIAGDAGRGAQGAARLVADLPGISSHVLQGYDWCCAAIKVRKSDNQGEKAFCRLRRREGGARPEAQATEELV